MKRSMNIGGKEFERTGHTYIKVNYNVNLRKINFN